MKTTAWDIGMDIAFDASLLFLWLGGIVAVLVGVAMLCAPERLARVSQVMSRWIDTSRLENAMSRPRPLDRFFYRHHRVVGAFLLAGASIVVYKLLLARPPEQIAWLAKTDSYGLIEAIFGILVIGSVIGFFIGACVLFRPSLLREIEAASNRWISTEVINQFFSRTHGSVDQWLMGHRKVVGIFLITSGIYIFATLGSIVLS